MELTNLVNFVIIFVSLLLTSVFHKGLRFMAVGWGLRAAFGGSSPLVFKLPFHASFNDLIIFSFLDLFFFLHRHFISFMTPKSKKEQIRLFPSSLNSFYYFFTFWFKGLSFKTQFKIKFWPPVNGGQSVLE